MNTKNYTLNQSDYKNIKDKHFYVQYLKMRIKIKQKMNICD